MKCPECGFDRDESDRECLMCGFNFDFEKKEDTKAAEEAKLTDAPPEAEAQGTGEDEPVSEGAIEMPEDFHEEAPGPENSTEQASPDSESPPPPEENSSSESGDEPLKMEDDKPKGPAVVGFCPNCKGNKLENDLECRQCGIIYEKFGKPRTQEVSPPEPPPPPPPPPKPPKPKPEKTGPGAFEKLIEKFKNIPPKTYMIAAVVLIVCAVGATGYVVGKNWLEASAKKRAAEEKLAAEQAKAKTFKAHIDALNIHIRALIDDGNFELAQMEIKKYDVPQLETDPDMRALKRYLEEIKLVFRAKSIPSKDYAKNYNIYKQLIGYNPSNKVYQKKHGYFKKRLADDHYAKAKTYYLKRTEKSLPRLKTAIEHIDKARELISKNSKFRKLEVRLKTDRLLFYEGNDKIQMALRNDGISKKDHRGQRKLTVWLKNIGKEQFHINLDFFTLVGKDGKKYAYNDFSQNLVTALGPGEEVQGNLFFYTKSAPKTLVFSHIRMGVISREFP